VQTSTLFASFIAAIEVVSDGLHSQKQCIIIPSVCGSSSKQVYFFLFVCGMFLIAFVEKLVPECRCELRVMRKWAVVLVIDVATAFPEKQLLGLLWQIKKQYSCWLFWFCGCL
jgi:hypothetical protein